MVPLLLILPVNVPSPPGLTLMPTAAPARLIVPLLVTPPVKVETLTSMPLLNKPDEEMVPLFDIPPKKVAALTLTAVRVAVMVPLLVIPPKKVETPLMAIPMPDPMPALMVPELTIPPPALLAPNTATVDTRMPVFGPVMVPALEIEPAKVPTPAT